MNGDGAFNGKILVDKLAKLNSSQQSIETLSHWCIFHRKNAKQVVETWAQQFYCSPSDQRVSFLYLANDILQNSRRKGMEYVGEFWKVLPNALNDVIENGDESGRKAALRLVDIWEERKVFNPRGQTLKEHLLGRTSNEKSIHYEVRQPARDVFENLISSFLDTYDGPDVDTICKKVNAAHSTIEKVEKELGSDLYSGKINASGVSELQMHLGTLRECMEQLKDSELLRRTLVSHITEAMNEEESKLERLRKQLQVAEEHNEIAARLMAGLPPHPPQPERNADVVPPPTPASQALLPHNFCPQQQQQGPAPSDMAVNQTRTNEEQKQHDPCSDADNKRPTIDNGNVPCYSPEPLQPPLLPSPLPHPMLPPATTLLPLQPPMMPGYPVLVGVPPFPGLANLNYHLQEAAAAAADGAGGFVGQQPPPYTCASPSNVSGQQSDRTTTE